MLLNKFFPIVDTCLSYEDIARCGKVVGWCQGQGVVDIQPAATEIRRGKKEEEERNYRAKI